jgi:putative MFS transporter
LPQKEKNMEPYARRVFLAYASGFAADGMEMYVMSLILPELPMSWALTTSEKGMLGGFVFFGMSIGSLLWGMLADRIGRLPVLRVCILLILLLGLASALANSFAMLLATRFCFGLAMGGFVPVGNTLLCEATAAGHRGYAVALAEVAFSLGGVFETLLAMPILPNMHPGWAWLLFFSAVPLLFPTALLFWPGYLVESPLWLRQSGRHAQADVALLAIERINGGRASGAAVPHAKSAAVIEKGLAAAMMPLAESAGKGSTGERGVAGRAGGASNDGTASAPAPATPATALSPLAQTSSLVARHWRTSIALWPMWACMSIGYYGLVFTLPTYLQRTVPQEVEFGGTLLAALAEVPGNLIGGSCSDAYGRKRTLIVSFCAAACLALACGLATLQNVPWALLLLLCCFLKVSLNSAFTTIYVYSSEAYPTVLSAFGLGACSLFTRVAGGCTPLISQSFLDYNGGLAIFAFYSGTCGLASVLAVFLPFETLGRDPDETEDSAVLRETSPLLLKQQRVGTVSTDEHEASNTEKEEGQQACIHRRSSSMTSQALSTPLPINARP